MSLFDYIFMSKEERLWERGESKADEEIKNIVIESFKHDFEEDLRYIENNIYKDGRHLEVYHVGYTPFDYSLLPEEVVSCIQSHLLVGLEPCILITYNSSGVMVYVRVFESVEKLSNYLTDRILNRYLDKSN